MKKLILPVVAVLLCGCSSVGYTNTKPDGTKTDFNASVPFWSNSTLKGLTVDGTTKTTSAGLKIQSSTIEPNVESITATADALGSLIGAAAAATAKGAVKP